jgi:hypothetical protein
VRLSTGRRTLAVAGVLVTVTGCTGNAKGGSFRPSDSGVVSSSSAPAGTAQFPFPDRTRVVFETPVPPDATQARVFTDYEYVMSAYYYAAQTQGKDRRYLDRILGAQRAGFAGSIDALIKAHKAPLGTLRFFNTRVPAVYGRGASVETCVDESRFGGEDARTGKPLSGSTPGPVNAFYKQRTGMQRGDDGTWRLVDYETDLLPDPRAKECQP